MPTTWGVLDGRLSQLERRQRQSAGAVQNTDTYQFVISPTCPPSVNIRFRGGLCWHPPGAGTGYGFYIPGYTVDLTDSAIVSVRLNYSGYTYTFTNADWYVPCFIVLSAFGLAARETWPATVPNDAIYLRGTTGASPYMEEFATFREAEDELMAAGDIQLAEGYGLVVSGLILRNNGNTIDSNQWMAIDKVNRGRSYLYWNTKPSWEMG